MVKRSVYPLDNGDPNVIAFAKAEQKVFDHYGLEVKTHFVQLKQPELKVRVLEVGSGDPLLMVPGGSGDAFIFAPLLAGLADWRILAIDRPGGGMSDGIDHRQVNLRHLAVDTLTTVLDTFQLNAVPIIGNSMGGLWSFWLALDRPDRVNRMVQLGCPALILNTAAP